MTVEFEATGFGRGVKTTFIVDDEDAEFVAQRAWQCDRGGYISTLMTLPEGRKRVQLARWLLGLTDRSLDCDHRDGNPQNNTRANLRVATRLQNLANRRKWSLGATSGTSVKGVNLTPSGRYRAQRKENGRSKARTFDTIEEAAAWYEAEQRRLHGEFALEARHA